MTVDQKPRSGPKRAPGVTRGLVGRLFEALHERIARSRLPELDATTGAALKHSIQAAQATGLRIDHLEPAAVSYIYIARDASNHGYTVVFIAVAAIALVAACLVGWLVRKPQPSSEPSSARTDGSGDEPSRR